MAVVDEQFRECNLRLLARYVSCLSLGKVMHATIAANRLMNFLMCLAMSTDKITMLRDVRWAANASNLYYSGNWEQDFWSGVGDCQRRRCRDLFGGAGAGDGDGDAGLGDGPGEDELGGAAPSARAVSRARAAMSRWCLEIGFGEVWRVCVVFGRWQMIGIVFTAQTPLPRGE